MRTKLEFITVLCTLLCVLGFQKNMLGRLNVDDSEFNPETRRSRLTNVRLLPKVGLHNLFADLVFIDFLLYFGDDRIEQDGYPDSPEFMKTVIANDPYFMDFHLFLSQSTTIYAGRPEKTIEILNEGISLINGQYPADGYRIWRYKAMDELLFLGDVSEAQKSYEEAGKLAAQSSELSIQSVGHRSFQTAAFLAGNPDSRQARVNAWGSLMTTTFSDDARQRAAEEIKKLGGEVTFNENGGISVKYEPAVQQSSQEESNS